MHRVQRISSLTSVSFRAIDDCMNPRKKTSSPRPALSASKLRSCTQQSSPLASPQHRGTWSLRGQRSTHHRWTSEIASTSINLINDQRLHSAIDGHIMAELDISIYPRAGEAHPPFHLLEQRQHGLRQQILYVCQGWETVSLCLHEH